MECWNLAVLMRRQTCVRVHDGSAHYSPSIMVLNDVCNLKQTSGTRGNLGLHPPQ